jgi:diacylglycerol O-acyltransferase
MSRFQAHDCSGADALRSQPYGRVVPGPPVLEQENPCRRGSPPSVLSNMDAIIWREGLDPEILTIVTNVAILNTPPEPRKVHQALNHAISLAPRLRQIICRPRWGHVLPYWQDDPFFTLSNHLHWAQCPGEGEPDLLALAATISGQSFAPDHPFWSVTIVEGLRGGRGAVVLKRHHAVIDGVGLTRLLRQITVPSAAPDHNDRAAEYSVGHRAEAAAASTADGSKSSSVTDVICNSLLAARSWMPARRRKSSVMRGRSRNRRFLTLSRPLSEFQNAARTIGNCTLNDVFLAAVTLGLAAYHISHGGTDKALRASLPINVREENDSSIGNRFTVIRFMLPLMITDPIECIRRCHDRIRRERKLLPSGMTANIMPALLSRLPSVFSAVALGGILKGVDVSTTNVICSTSRLSFAGAEVERYFTFGGLCGAAIMIALYSYAGEANFGINTDGKAVPDPEHLVECVASGISQIVRLGNRDAI